MSDFTENKFKSANQTWETPDDLFQRLNDIYHFTRDVCASKENTKCAQYWTEEDSCLTKTWDGVNWMNPPYKNMKKFIQKAYDERERAITVCLIPSRTNTKWWHEYCMKGNLYFICGRPRFSTEGRQMEHGLPQPLTLVVFGQGSGIVESFFYS